MRFQAAMASFVLGVFCVSSGTAHAQLKEAVSAFEAAMREANRALNPRRSRRKGKYGLRSTLPADQGPPPLPVGNPQRQAEQPKPNKRRATKLDRRVKPAGLATPSATPPKQVKTARPAPPPDIWSPAQIAKARKQCKAILRKVNAKLAPTDPIKKGPCGDAAPYRLVSLGKKHRVVFKPAAVLNCPMIQALDTWFRKGLQPLAKRHLGGPITQVSVMSSYSCRNAYGRKKTRLSEHGKANALDIGGFRTSQGVTAYLLADWGPTQRDLIAKAKREEEARRARERIAAAQPGQRAPKTQVESLPPAVPSHTSSLPRGLSVNPAPTRQARSPIFTQPQFTPSRTAPSQLLENLPPPLPKRRPSLRERLDWAKAERERLTAKRANTQRGTYKDELNNFLYPRQDLGGPKSDTRAKSRKLNGQRRRGKLNKEAFLKGAHRTACQIFGTVLGPEANDAHRDHFHVDLAERRYRNYCR